MSRISFTSQPFLLGFEQFDRLVERATKAGVDGYPPFNIEQHGEDAYRVTLAVAGFAAADLGVTVEEQQLIIRGRQGD
ncbi:MAG: Hsp20 family protein, partial [Limibaculum sp.]